MTRFVQPEKIEIDANERAVNEKSQYCFFVCTTFDSFLNDLVNFEDTFFLENIIYNELKARDYEVFTGKTYKGGMDFVVINGRKKCFIQVAY